MPEIVGEAFVQITPLAAGFGAQTQAAVSKSLPPAGVPVKAGLDEKASAPGFLKGGLGLGASALAGFGVAFGATALVGVLSGSIDEAVEAGQVQAQLSRVFAGSAGNIKEFKTAIDELSTAQGKKVVVDNDLIEKGNVLLLQTPILKDLFISNRQAFFDLANAALDASSALGIEYPAAAGALARALADPTEGIANLRRLNINFTEAQEESIKAFLAQGNAAGATGILVGVLEEKYKGAAKAAGDSAGPSQKLGVAFAELQESIGKLLLPILVPLVEALLPLFEVLGQLLEAFAPLISIAVPFFTLGLQLLAPILELISPLIASFSNFLKDLLAPISDLGASVGEIFPAIGGIIGSVVGGILDALGRVGGAIGDVIGFFAGLPGAIFDAIGDLVGGLFDLGGQVISGFIDGLIDGAKAIPGIIGDIGKSVLGSITSVFDIFSPSRETRRLGRFISEGLALGISDGTKGVTAAGAGLAFSAGSGISLGGININQTLNGPVSRGDAQFAGSHVRDIVRNEINTTLERILVSSQSRTGSF